MRRRLIVGAALAMAALLGLYAALAATAQPPYPRTRRSADTEQASPPADADDAKATAKASVAPSGFGDFAYALARFAATSTITLAPGLFAAALVAARHLRLSRLRPMERTLSLGLAGGVVLLLLSAWLGVSHARVAVLTYAVASALVLSRAATGSRGLRRAVRFWSVVGRMIVHYRLVDVWARHADVDEAELEHVYAEMHARYAPRVLALILVLRGFYVKLGQVMSVMEFIPRRYREELATLQSGVPPKSGHEVRDIVSGALGQPWDAVFRLLDEEPLGSASIGQVHRATMLDGRRVVVKVQYPEVRALFDTDFANLRIARRLYAPHMEPELSEFRRQLMSEFDFRREARTMARIADNLGRAFPEVAVPRPVTGLASRDVLVMSELAGTSLMAGLEALARAYADSQGISVDELKRQLADKARAEGGEEAEGGAMGGKLKLTMLKTYLRASTLARSTGVKLYNSSIGRIAGSPLSAPLPPLFDPETAIRKLAAVLGHQVLRDGLFSSDMHPGNVMLLPDGRIGLIDFGQAKELTPAEQRLVSRIVVAVADNDEAAMVSAAAASRFRTKRNDPKTVARYVRLAWAGDVKELRALHKEDPVEQTDGQLLMVRRAVILLRSLALALGIRLNLAEEWAALARSVLAEGRGGDDDEVDDGAGRSHDGVRVTVTRAPDGKRNGLRVSYFPVDASASSSKVAVGATTDAEAAADGGGGGGAVDKPRPEELDWSDSYKHSVWGHLVQGGTVNPIVDCYGELALIRLGLCVGRASACMPRDGSKPAFRIGGSSPDDDDRLQLLRALAYLTWGHASKACTATEASGATPRHYVISAGVTSVPLKGPWRGLAARLDSSPIAAREVRKYFPRHFLERLEASPDSEVATPINSLLDAVAALVEAPGGGDDDGATNAEDDSDASFNVIHSAYGEMIKLPSASAEGGTGAVEPLVRQQQQQAPPDSLVVDVEGDNEVHRELMVPPRLAPSPSTAAELHRLATSPRPRLSVGQEHERLRRMLEEDERAFFSSQIETPTPKGKDKAETFDGEGVAVRIDVHDGGGGSGGCGTKRTARGASDELAVGASPLAELGPICGWRGGVGGGARSVASRPRSPGSYSVLSACTAAEYLTDADDAYASAEELSD